jgi:hypothetical protein
MAYMEMTEYFNGAIYRNPFGMLSRTLRNIQEEMKVSLPRIGCLTRIEDVSGVSGTGRIATVLAFDDKCIVYWGCSSIHQVEIFDSVEDLISIHGHEGKTTVVWI